MRPATLIVGQSGGPTAVINRSLAGIVEAAIEAEHDVDEVLGARHGVEGLLAGELTDLRPQGPGFLGALKQPPSSILASCLYKLRDEHAERALVPPRRVGAPSFIYIGGNH